MDHWPNESVLNVNVQQVITVSQLINMHIKITLVQAINKMKMKCTVNGNIMK